MPETSNPTSRPRVLSGMRPTGKLHLGNYMGALANWVKLQDSGEYECYFFIADWHALTTDYADPNRLKLNTLDVALDWLAAGLDPTKSTIFIQSHVPQHAELHLLFSMMTPLGWLERVPTYKEQQENLTGKDLSTYGFLGYPLLQASDILIYQAQYVPVGQDQVAHVELTREVARRFNSMYKSSIFPEPDALLTPSPKVTGTDGRKMSKSYGNTIGLTEAPAVIAKKIGEMSTNGQRLRQTDPGDPDLCPVGDLHKTFSPPEVISETQLGCKTASLRCDFCKVEAAKSICAITEPIYEKRRRLESQVEESWQMLRGQSSKAAARAEETMVSVRSVFDLSHDLGAVKRHFLATEEDRHRNHDLSSHSDWRNLPAAQRGKLLGDYWRTNLVPYDIPLSQESNRVFTSLERELEEPLITRKKKRLLVTTALDREMDDQGAYSLQVPGRSYEIWALLCWERSGNWLHDFIIPQKYYSAPFSVAKKSLAKVDGVPLTVRREGTRFWLTIAGSEAVDITETESNYNPLT